jgi:hypothetical protein
MPENLFIRTTSQSDLMQFATAVFNLLNIQNLSKRESENYADGEYVVGEALGVIVKVALADDSEFSDYQFWIEFKPRKAWPENPSALDGLADLISKQLALEGYEVARSLSFGKIGGAKVLYSKKATNDDIRDQLDIKHIS